MKKKIETLVNDEFKEFIAILNKHKVDYCITGAYAVSFYAEPRSTWDMDFFVEHSKDNSVKVAAAIKEFMGVEVDETYFNTDKTVVLRMGIEPNQIEISNGLSGLTTDEISQHKVQGKYGDISAYYIGIDELIKNKSIVKDMPHRGRKKGSDSTDYETLKIVKNISSKKGIRK
jgi:hypothetical protein